MSIKIVTDSTCDIPKNLLNRYEIIELPLTVHFGEQEYKDRIEITTEQFFEKLVKSKNLPTTSQVNPLAFTDVYKRELESGNGIISIHISGDLSGTYQSAVIAKESLESDRISIIDSRSATISLGLIVLKAAELAESGMEKSEIVKSIEDYKKKVKLLIVVDTLEYLKKGGRLSGAQAIIGGILKVKPILTINDGKVVVIDKARGVKKAFKSVIEIMKEKGNFKSDNIIGIANANCPETIEELKPLITGEFGNVRFVETSVGSVIATHVGPGAFGIAFIEK